MGRQKTRGNGEGSVYKVTGDRRLHWCANITLGWRTDGRPIRKARYATSRAAALDKLKALRRERDLGLRGADQTLAEFLERWLASVDVRDRTLVNYAGACKLYLVPLLGHRKLLALTPGEIREALTSMQRERKDGTTVPLSAKTRGNVLGTLRSALSQAVRDGILERNPAALVAAPKGEAKPRATLTTEQVRMFLAAVKDDRLYALYVLALSTGMRQGELLGLKWEDVEGDRLHVRRALARIDGEYVRVPTKSASSRRDIVLGRLAVTALADHRRTQRREQLAAGPKWAERGLVFTRPDGEALNSRVVTLAFQDHLAAAKLPKVTFHSLRHWAATTLVASSGDLKMAQAVLGHSNIGVTADVYAHVVESQLRRAADLMEEALA